MSDSYQQILDRLGNARRVLVTTHVRPDGDALGTAAAMVLGMRAKNIAAEVLLLSHLPTKYAFVFKEAGIVHHDAEAGWPASLSLADFDLLLVVDTGTWSQLPGLKEKIAGWNVPKLVVDHHLTQEDWADAKLVVTEAAAAAEIAAELLDQWEVKLDEPIARALFLAISSDTGWFQFSNTRPYTLRLAARLIEAGVNIDQMYQLMYQNERAARVTLQTRALQSLELMQDGRLAVMRVRKKDFEETNANVPDTENLINVPLQIRTVEVSILLTEPKDFGPVRISLRSKGQVDVARFAEQFGGGGHARASGLKIEGTLDEARDKVVGAMVGAMSGGIES
ncbi:MAG TPA: bifunctional oligoribonuclease/PAP phosphatase NrnA [Tepidisphaeraceae bacterium]|jgi:phosphoesterase RecJ-like protein|nr:bifunctional oligoribonuclease/PAP phosphatase NrnA [Tepidisphaeraceae bacterium]